MAIAPLLSSAEVCARSGMTYRQLSYWIEAGVIRPARVAGGSGDTHGWTEEQASLLLQIVGLRRMGVPLALIRDALVHDGSLEPLCYELIGTLAEVLREEESA